MIPRQRVDVASVELADTSGADGVVIKDVLAEGVVKGGIVSMAVVLFVPMAGGVEDTICGGVRATVLVDSVGGGSVVVACG